MSICPLTATPDPSDDRPRQLTDADLGYRGQAWIAPSGTGRAAASTQPRYCVGMESGNLAAESEPARTDTLPLLCRSVRTSGASPITRFLLLARIVARCPTCTQRGKRLVRFDHPPNAGRHPIACRLRLARGRRHSRDPPAAMDWRSDRRTFLLPKFDRCISHRGLRTATRARHQSCICVDDA